MPLSHNDPTDNTLQKDTLLQTPPEYGLKQGIILRPNNNQLITKRHPAPGFRHSPPRMTSSRCRKGYTASAVIQTTAGNQFPEADFTAHGRFRRMCPAGTQEDDSPDMALRGPCLYPRTAQPHSHKTAHRRTPRALFTSLMVRGKICFYIMTTPARLIKPAWRIQGKSFRIFIQPEKQVRTLSGHLRIINRIGKMPAVP